MADDELSLSRVLRQDIPRQPNGKPDLSNTPAFGQKGFEAFAKEFGPGIALDTAGLAAGPIGRGVSAVAGAIRSAPTLAKRLLAGGGVASASATAGEGGDLDPRVAEIAKLEKEIKATEAQLQRMATIKYQSTVARELATKPIQDGVDAARTRIATLTGELDEAQKKKDRNNQDFSGRHPEAALAMTVGGPIASLALGRWGLNKINDVGRNAAAAAEAARGAGKMGEMAKQLVKGQNWEKWAPKAKAAVLGEAAAIPAELRAATDFIDKKTLPPDSKARQAIEEKHKLENLPGYLAGMGLDVVSGGIGALTGAALSRTSPKVDVKTMSSYLTGMPKHASPDELAVGLSKRAAEAAQAEAALRATKRTPQALPLQERQPSLAPASLSTMLQAPQSAATKSLPGPTAAQSGQEATPSLSSSSPQTIYRVKGSDGKVRLHGEDGKYVPKPAKRNSEEDGQ